MNGPPATVDGPDERTDRRDRFCIVGAGSSGLTAAKALAEAGIPFDCLERQDDIGGNWNYDGPAGGVYASTHMISSKRLTEYVDFPMPKEYPPYPHHRQILEYLRAYARKFGLYERIEFGRSIERIERTPASSPLPANEYPLQNGIIGEREQPRPPSDSSDGRPRAVVRPEGHEGRVRANPSRPQAALGPAFSDWTVKFADGSTRRYRGLIIANGHNWDPRLPEYPGTFHGTAIHSRAYKTPDIFTGKRVLVVGAGNSGCDIAVEAAQHAERTLLSMRRGYHFLPKFWQGAPIDRLNEKLLQKRLPLFLRRWLGARVERAAFGKSGRYGLPVPDHRLFESHPIINQQLFYWLAHGRITPKPDLTELCGGEVRFADGSREPVDLIIWATGYNISFPFLDRELLNWRDGRPRLYLNVFHPEADDLFVLGLIQPDSGQFGLVDLQARLVAKFVREADAGSPKAEAFRRLKRANVDEDLTGGIRHLNSPRHLLEVEHFSYRRKLERLIGAR